MSPTLTPIRSRTRLQFVEAAGNLCRRLGLPRSLGQIYGLLFFSTQPLSLDDIVQDLRISKASASTGTRQLASWGAIRQVWVPGNRRDYFEVTPDMGKLLRNIYRDVVKPRLTYSQQRFDDLVNSLDEESNKGILTREECAVYSERLRNLSRLQKRIRSATPVLERFL